MPSLLAIAGTLLAAYASSYVYTFVKNAINARKSGLPAIWVPWNPQDIFWMITSPPLRGWYEQHLPAVIFNRLTLCLYGWEYFQRNKPFDLYCGSRADLKTFMLVTCGKLEFYTSNAEMVAQILARPRDFCQFDNASWFMSVFGHNVLTTDGDHWARQRKIVASVVNERVSKAVFHEGIVQTEGLLKELSRNLKPDGRMESNQLFNMAKKVTINVLSGAGMGNEVPWDDKTDEQPRPGYKQTYIQSVKQVINSVAGPIILPLWFLRLYPSFLPGADFMHDLAVAKSEFPAHTLDILEKERIRSKEEGNATKNNILSQLLQASEQPVADDAKNVKGNNSKALSDSELVGNLFIFTAAGFDTTANTISYAMIYLARYPEWQDWVLEEIDAILPEDSTAELDYVAVYPKVLRVMALMLETLRHFTPLIHISKQTRIPQTIATSTGNYLIPPNTTIYINTIALHGDAKVWRGLNAAPRDKIAEDDEWQFRPSRFVNPPGSSQPLFQPPKGAYIPWSTGPRVCPGQKMAQVEFTAIFLTLLRQHRIEAVPLPGETRAQTDARLDATMHNSMSIMTLTMKDVYDVPADSDQGLKLAVVKRR